MQRYSGASSSGGVGNSSVGGASARDAARTDSSFPTSNFSLNPRRTSQLTPYKLKCDKEPLSGRLGPPDFYPQTPNCPEEAVTREYLQSGYKETVEGIEEAREIQLTHVGSFVKSDFILKCKELLRKRLRAINESRTQKRKAGQVYGVPLTGPLLIKPGVFPEQKACVEDFRRKWIEGLSQQHKRLRSLADHIPHGYRKKSLFEVLIRHNVPLLRATWFIKVTYLNQVRPTNVSSGAPDKLQYNRTELWTKDVIEYLQQLLDEFLSKDGCFAAMPSRDQSSKTLLPGAAQHKNDSGFGITDAEDPSLQFRWFYMVRLLQWHHAEGLLLQSLVIEWALNLLQEKESADALELLLPIVYVFIDGIALSQTYVRMFVDMAIRFINDPSTGGLGSAENSKRPSLAYAIAEIVRYLILGVPDTFVSLDCFPLPVCVVPDIFSRNTSLRLPEAVDDAHFETRDSRHRYLSFGYIASSIKKRAANLAKIINPSLQGHGVAKVVPALDKVLIDGDVNFAYNALFEDLSSAAIEEAWIAEVSPRLKSSLKWIGSASSTLVCSVFFLCEWATCDYRDCRTVQPNNIKLTGRKDFCQVYVAVLLLKLKNEYLHGSSNYKNGSPLITSSSGKSPTFQDDFSGRTTVENVSMVRNNPKSLYERKNKGDVFESPGPLHDIVVCWLDQHEVGRGEGDERLQVLIVELIRYGIFYPQAYVRQLIVSGIMDVNETVLDLNRQIRHYRILKQLPGSCLFDALEEARIAEVPMLHEVVRVYTNERRLVLHGCSNHCSSHAKARNDVLSRKRQKDYLASVRDSAQATFLEGQRNFNVTLGPSVKHARMKDRINVLKGTILSLLHIPNSCSSETRPDESQGSVKRPLGLLAGKVDLTDGTPGCEECRRAKRQKLSDERSSFIHGFSSNQSDDEDTWWARKGTKSFESFKVEPSLKLAKPTSRGRRKTQSLAQLQATRIEGSQGASTSHVCDSKVNCPHHRSSVGGEVPRDADRLKAAHLSDITRTLKQLRSLEKRFISIWLVKSLKELVEANEKAASKMSHSAGAFSIQMEERSDVQWRMGEEELSAILYLLDISSDLISAVKFLIWLLPKAPSGSSPTMHAGRNMMVLGKNKEHHVCSVGEVFILSSLQRYENVFLATDLLPEFLTAAMNRCVAMMASNVRSSGSMAFAYARHLLKKCRGVGSIAKWEKNFRATCDQRLLQELDAGQSMDGDLGFSAGVPGGVEDHDEYLRQKLSSRLPRAGTVMKELVQRHIDEAVRVFTGKERKVFTSTTTKNPFEKWDDGYQTAQEIVSGLFDCGRQNGGGAQEMDSFMVASVVSAIVANIGPAVAKLADVAVGSNYQSFSSTLNSLSCVRHILHIHIICLRLLKEALGEHLSRIFEIALAAEASTSISGAFSPAKAPRTQYQLSPEAHDVNPNNSNDILNNSLKVFVGKASRSAAAVSALVVGAIVNGVASLERMITVFKIKEGLDVLQFIRSLRSSSNGMSRSFGTFKLDYCLEVYVHWFRLLVGNCGMVFDGLVGEILGESYTLALSRMQRMLPLNLVFPPAYSIFAMVIWRPYILNSNIATREDIQLYHCLSLAIGDTIKHRPFRDICLRNIRVFYDLIVDDNGDSEFAAMLELHNPDKRTKTMAFVPLRARLFLNAIIDSKMPPFTMMMEDGSCVSGPSEPRTCADNEMKLLDQLVHVLDTLQPAKFHWQWVELRLLLNEQVLIEKIETQNLSLVDAISSLSPNAENFALSENEKTFIEIVLTRLLVRPDAASLYSEVVSRLGRSLEESLFLYAKWFLGGSDVLLGRKSIRQRLVNVAQSRGLSTKCQFWKPWGWSTFTPGMLSNRGDKKKLEAPSIEEGEVVDDGTDVKRSGKMSFYMFDPDISSRQQCITERALAELIFPCIERSSSESRSNFAGELVKQFSTIEQHLNTLIRGGSKQAGLVEGPSNKGNSRKSIRGGSPGMGRRPAGVIDSSPPSAVALKASMWLRLQFLLRLLPIICADRTMRHMLATVILRLLGNRLVYEDADMPLQTIQSVSKRDEESLVNAPVPASSDLSGDSLFDMFLCVLHGLSNCKQSWLKPKLASKSTVKSPRDFSAFDREVSEVLQADLDRMELPATVRRRIQAAMPMLPPTLPFSISCHPPSLSSAVLASLQPSTSTPGFQQGSLSTSQRSLISSTRPSANLSGKSKMLLSRDVEVEIDPWTLLEDGTASVSTSSSSSIGGVSSDHSNLKACSWLKGAVRIRRTDLTYIGAVDDDS